MGRRRTVAHATDFNPPALLLFEAAEDRVRSNGIAPPVGSGGCFPSNCFSKYRSYAICLSTGPAEPSDQAKRGEMAGKVDWDPLASNPDANVTPGEKIFI